MIQKVLEIIWIVIRKVFALELFPKSWQLWSWQHPASQSNRVFCKTNTNPAPFTLRFSVSCAWSNGIPENVLAVFEITQSPWIWVEWVATLHNWHGLRQRTEVRSSSKTFTNKWKFLSLWARTKMRIRVSYRKIRSQNINVGLLAIICNLQASAVSSCPEPIQLKKASRWRICKVNSVTWWSCLAQVRWAAFNIDCAVPAEDTSAFNRADVHPEPSIKSPSTFQRAISVCKPSDMATYCPSPWVAGKCHWTSFARVK